MKIILDTHTFLWFINGDQRLSKFARKQIKNLSNQRLLSIASLWEMAIKANIGRLKLNATFSKLYTAHIFGNAIKLLQISPDHLDNLGKLPFYHKDPFDRLIISQSKYEKAAIISIDRTFDKYKVKRIWSRKNK